MNDRRFDVVVVGSGPAGGTAALVLARAGARVALVDKAPFPREKACGDLIGPRGVQTLRDLQLDVRGAARVGDMIVVGPSGNRVRLPATPGRTYPGYGIVVERSSFDAICRVPPSTPAPSSSTAARTRPSTRTDASPASQCRRPSCAPTRSSVPTERRAASRRSRGSWTPAACSGGSRSAPTSTSRWKSPTSCCGLRFGVRRSPATAGCSPPARDSANVGLGIGVLADRSAARRATRDLAAFLEHARRVGVLR